MNESTILSQKLQVHLENNYFSIPETFKEDLRETIDLLAMIGDIPGLNTPTLHVPIEQTHQMKGIK